MDGKIHDFMAHGVTQSVMVRFYLASHSHDGVIAFTRVCVVRFRREFVCFAAVGGEAKISE